MKSKTNADSHQDRQTVKLAIIGLNQKYGEKPVLVDINLKVREGETLVILGSSGCGKTTLLKAVAGLVAVQSGEIRLDGVQVENLPPQKRRATMVFQNYALFPHMTVRENLEYGLKINHVSRELIRTKREEVVRILHLDGLEERPVARLSGGQQQRVAIGRALIVEPPVLLFDEPLSNLDENLRKSMRREIKRILRELGCTSLYVTHDQNEAIAMADRVVVMSEGVIEQIDTPEALYRRPVSEKVARFLGFRNIFPARMKEGKLYIFGLNREIELPMLTVDGEGESSVDEEGLEVLIRPEEIRLSAGAEISGQNVGGNSLRLKGIVADQELQIGIRIYTIDTEMGQVNVNALNSSGSGLYKTGDEVCLQFSSESFHLLGQRSAGTEVPADTVAPADPEAGNRGSLE